MWNASFEAAVSNLCRELVESRNDLDALELHMKEINEVLEERILVLRHMRRREAHNPMFKSTAGSERVH
ncbi:MAG TPA: hypothetical protein VGS78_16265 [Candidatus Sulfotelmatobacter sp.]|nr:hypothetical protein [Candidatus Sulfotelmatobacter sp.]